MGFYLTYLRQCNRS